VTLFRGALGTGVGGVVWAQSAKDLGVGLIIGMLVSEVSCSGTGPVG
jgi:hypothetical protein